MAEKKTLKLADLIKDKMKYQRGLEIQTEELEIERLEATVIIEIPDDALCLDALNQKDDESGSKSDDYLVYTIMHEPNLKDKELQKEYGCVEPTDIVSTIFTRGEIADIASYALDKAGFKRGTVKAIEKVKN
ncbi:MAG: hypothetical protein ABS944_16345 [Solibacillus sp.]|uniref:phage tail assembly chaperone n=1 Tax=Solibacillus sp. TaxID=1909654 RepID=UPI0033146DB4